MVIIKFISEYLLPNNFTGISFTKFDKVFRKNNIKHRYYGPAGFHVKSYKAWFFNDKPYGYNYYDTKYNQKQFIKDVSKQWLL